MSNQNRMPLVEALQYHEKRDPVSFHVPGHKNGKLLNGQAGEFLQYDVTELTGLDDLHAPSEAIREAQELLADHFQTRKSYFLVNGSTVGNLAMIMGVCKEGDIVFVQRNCHKSILNGLKLANVQPVFLHPEFDEETATTTGISQGTLKEAIGKYAKAKAVILTYPTYYGMVYDLHSIIELAHKHGMKVLIDEAHGAHLSNGEPFPASSLRMGADIVVQSAHKTLPAMTMGSYLHINNDQIDAKRVEEYLGMLQSSSPSYPIMGSLDYARHFIASYSSEDLYSFLRIRKDFINRLHEAGFEVIESNDPLKVMIRLRGLSGFQLQDQLENVGIYAELADPHQVLFILPLLKKDTSFPFEEVVKKMSGIKASQAEDTPIVFKKSKSITSLRYSYREMETKTKKWIAIEDAAGKTAGEMLTPYPPGIPLFYPGEEITEESIAELRRLWELGAKFQGEHLLGEGRISIFE
ncbi:aminotransferase class I/II-fold pyridoxal phosphate-dependent enzyme [Bacillus sp. SG-1]|uniref:aminotransferase class I/II-fold pyridoxal phosphate-dependent enzyme n=1 Tax=Bacillus sp. SG-1 TaxID=161544 RepID=UPI00015447A3|nr:aminotransferase class I/II-fold pyridoxal phosphate-dependent enzyme [Bacillus sp. SG-1]EDL63782.1 Arginine decarboxylase [Bacillus sp. SG-1]